MRLRTSVLILAAWLLSAAAFADSSAYLTLDVTALKLKEGALPTSDPQAGMPRIDSDLAEYYQPYAVLDGPGEVYITRRERSLREERDYETSPNAPSRFQASFAVAPGQAISGRLFWPNRDQTGMLSIKFTADPAAASNKPSARKQFFSAKARHYQDLAERNLAGNAWFRHQADLAHTEAGETTEPLTATQLRFRGRRMNIETENRGEQDNLYEFFSGGRAVAENLPLTRQLAVTHATSLTVELTSLPALTLNSMDWKPLIAGKSPQLDPLAAFIPADQHAIFFPTCQSLLDVLNNSDFSGTPLALFTEPRSEDNFVRERYERQLCLASDALSRLVGPRLVKSIAITGSDPYLRTGSDVAVLFAANDPAALQTLLAARHAAALAANPTAKAVSGQVAGVAYQGVVSPDRAICSYLLLLGPTVAVSNSLAQLERIVQAQQGKITPLTKADEYTFFRDRYKLGDAGETALVVLTDATIRRWCGPRMRIANERRLRAASTLAELQARNLDKLAHGEKPTPTSIPGAGDITWTPTGPQSPVYGTLSFMTPLAEIPIDKVSTSEADAYHRFLLGYQHNWTQYLDPLALRLALESGHLKTDLTLTPLILDSEYREFVQLSHGAAIKPGAGDPHPDALAHFVFAINKQSELLSGYGTMFNSMGNANPAAQAANPLGWLGTSVALYADPDPFWGDLLKAAAQNQESSDDYVEKNMARMPLALQVEVSDGLKLAVFLTTLRTMAQQSAPGLTNWSVEQYKDHPYTRITIAEPGANDATTSGGVNYSIYYAATPHALILTLNRPMLERALDRMTARAKQDKTPADQPWLGDQLDMRAQRAAFDLFAAVSNSPMQDALHSFAWDNIPVLNEWHRLHPELAPAAFHERFWQARLATPETGDYVWNDQWQTMESTLYGSPANPKSGNNLLGNFLSRMLALDMGITFENGGLHARANFDFTPAQP